MCYTAGAVRGLHVASCSSGHTKSHLLLDRGQYLIVHMHVVYRKMPIQSNDIQSCDIDDSDVDIEKACF